MPQVGDWLTFALLSVVLIIAAVADWRTGLVPNRLTGPAVLAGIILAAALGWYDDGAAGMTAGVMRSVGYMLLTLLAMAIAFFAGGIGGGDVKLMAAMGAILAEGGALVSAAMYSVIVAALFAVFIMVNKGLVRRTLHRLFGAAVSLATRTDTPMPDDSPRIPFAVAVCIGGLLAGAEYLLGLKLPWS